jgi:hypothetical protein
MTLRQEHAVVRSDHVSIKDVADSSLLGMTSVPAELST